MRDPNLPYEFYAKVSEISRLSDDGVTRNASLKRLSDEEAEERVLSERQPSSNRPRS